MEALQTALDIQLIQLPAGEELTVFSFGGGQDSFAILYRLVYDPLFRLKYAPGKLLVVMSDTGDEHDGTYFAVAYAKSFCKKHNIEFHFITPDMGYHSRTWRTLDEQYERNNTIGSVAFQQTCTDNLKIKVVDRFVEAWIKEKYGFTGKNKKAYWKFAGKYGKIRLIIGFAADEDHRTKDGIHVDDDPVWKQATVERCYPLYDLGMNRAACQLYIRSIGEYLPPPSNCKKCFWMTLPELLWLYRFERPTFWRWVRQERNKLNTWRAKGTPESKNMGVFGKTTIIRTLRAAIEKHGHWSDDQLHEYKMSHGHCVKSKF